MAKRYALKGVNDDETTCAVCGKVELKRVMWLVELDSDGNELCEPFHCGTVCGSKLMKIGIARVRKAADSYESNVNFRRSNIEHNHPAYEAAMKINHEIISAVGFTARKNHARWPELEALKAEAKAAADAAVIVIEIK